jgi:hypothetical protein
MRSKRFYEKGHLMAGLMAAVAILMIFSGVAFQGWMDVHRRDAEAEMIFRAQEIVRAIQRYRRDHGGMAPQKFDALLEPGSKGQYYIRQLYTDPLVPDGKWGFLYVAPGGGVFDPNAPASEVDPNRGSGLFNNPNSRLGQSGSNSGLNNNATQQNVAGGQPGNNPLGGQMNRNENGENGLPIAGVRTLADDQPFRVYNGRSNYAEWLFTYFDLENQMIGANPQSKAKQGRGGPLGRGRGPRGTAGAVTGTGLSRTNQKSSAPLRNGNDSAQSPRVEGNRNRRP